MLVQQDLATPKLRGRAVSFPEAERADPAFDHCQRTFVEPRCLGDGDPPGMPVNDELDEIQAIFFEECAEGLTTA